jgi:hypothetical protein
MLKISKTSKRLLLLLLAFFLSACAHSATVSPQGTRAVYTVSASENSLANRFAPALLANGYQDNQNRIGMPEVKYAPNGAEEIYMDVRKPAMYWMQRKFKTPKSTYTNLVYRIHFPEVPISLLPFYLTAGKNVGLLFIITLDAENRPVLVTTSGTCGCYAVTIPTQYLDESAYPKDWNPQKPLYIYGETLPRLLNFSVFDQPKFLVHLRSDVHRVMDLEVVDAAKPGRSGVQETIEASLLPMGNLEKIPAGYGRTTSLYYKHDGPTGGW